MTVLSGPLSEGRKGFFMLSRNADMYITFF